MSKLADVIEATLLQAIADSTAKIHPCPPLTLTTAAKFAVNGWIVSDADGFDCHVIAETGRPPKLPFTHRDSSRSLIVGDTGASARRTGFVPRLIAIDFPIFYLGPLDQVRFGHRADEA